jgi:hypothetical protein
MELFVKKTEKHLRNWTIQLLGSLQIPCEQLVGQVFQKVRGRNLTQTLLFYHQITGPRIQRTVYKNRETCVNSNDILLEPFNCNRQSSFISPQVQFWIRMNMPFSKQLQTGLWQLGNARKPWRANKTILIFCVCVCVCIFSVVSHHYCFRSFSSHHAAIKPFRLTSFEQLCALQCNMLRLNFHDGPTNLLSTGSVLLRAADETVAYAIFIAACKLEN